MSIKNITDKILSDAKDEKTQMLTKASAETKQLVDSRVKAATASEEQTLNKALEEAESRKSRIIQGAQLKARNEKLSAKHEVIEKTFKYALENLEKLDGTEFLNFLKSAIIGYKIAGEGILRVNEFRYTVITPEVLKEIRNETGVSLTLGRIMEAHRDGFIVEQKGISINCTFDSLVESLKEDLIFDITKILFE